VHSLLEAWLAAQSFVFYFNLFLILAIIAFHQVFFFINPSSCCGNYCVVAEGGCILKVLLTLGMGVTAFVCITQEQ